MERSLHCGNRYVVPYSNDRDLGNFFGSLPVDHGAEKKLDRVNAPRETKELVAARSTCLLASRSDLLGLLEEPIADPFSTIVTHDHNFFAAAERERERERERESRGPRGAPGACLLVTGSRDTATPRFVPWCSLLC